MSRRRVAVILGGQSPEHEVSVRSARSILSRLDRDRWDAVPIAITRSGAWLPPGETANLLEAGAVAFPDGGSGLLYPGAALNALAGCDVAFPIVHGTFGEDGALQGFLEMADVPYTGCGVAASAIGMDKALMKALFREAGVPQAEYLVATRHDLEVAEREVTASVESSLGYPAFVKPANGGSSVGVSRVASREDLSAAYADALRYDDKLLVEAAVTGQEVEVSVLGNEQPEVSICGEVVPDREFYDYASKYDPESRSALHIPARVPAGVAERVRDLAARMYLVMGCEGFARIDFFVAADGKVLANEINTIPGFTTISMYPKLWEASGLPYSDLLTRIIELGLERHAQRRSRL